MAEVIKDGGALASIQLNHGGRQAVSELNGGRNPIGPSAQVGRFTEDRRRGEQVVEEMTLAMIDEVIDHFAAAAFRAKTAGFDMVLVHAGHGWLISQFVSPAVNTRTDEYGGSLENRARFGIRVVDAIRERCGADFPIEWRISASDLVPGGLEIADAVEYARLMQDKVDCLQVSAGMIAVPHTYPYTHPSIYLPHGENVERAAEIKRAVTKPVGVVGAIMDLDEGGEWVAAGKADFVALCRALMADPQLAQEDFPGQEGRDHPLHPLQHLSHPRCPHEPVRCTVNPRSVREDYYRCLPPTAERKKVVVVGGGPAGMVAGITAAERGHEVVLFEKEDRLGGNLLISSGPPFKSDFRRYLDYLLEQVDRWAERGTLVVQVGTAGTPDRVATQSPDVVIAAVGAEPVWPDVVGLKRGNVFWAGDVLRGGNVLCHGDVLAADDPLRGGDVLCAGEVLLGVQMPGDRVVVAGTGGMGKEAALALAREGMKVTIVGIPGGSERDQTVNFLDVMALEDCLAEQAVEIDSAFVLDEVHTDRVVTRGLGGEPLMLPADAVVVATDLSPRTDLVKRLRDVAEDVRAVGDCRSPRILYHAVHEGFEAAIEI